MNVTPVEQEFILTILRESKEVRDAEGIVNETLDAKLAAAEAGDFSAHRSAFVPGANNGPHTTPTSPKSSNGTGRPSPAKASEKQVAFIVSLSDKLAGTEHEYLGLTQAKAEALTKVEASNTITELKAVADVLFTRKPEPRKVERTERPEAADEGLYFYEGTIVKVQTNRAGDRRYAKRYDAESNSYVYATGLQFKVTEKLTLAQATEIAKDANHSTEDGCICCGRKLTDEYSMSVKIGKICREKF